MNKIEQTIISIEVAEMVGKLHIYWLILEDMLMN